MSRQGASYAGGSMTEIIGAIEGAEIALPLEHVQEFIRASKALAAFLPVE
jgi:hypothetical protein